jgi:two-component system sensor kinase FixL
MTSASENQAEDNRDRRIQELERELAQLQRLTDLGQAMTTLVHEAHEPLTAISNYANACRRLVIAGNQDDVPIMLEHIADQTKRAGEILNRIRELVRKVDTRTEP